MWPAFILHRSSASSCAGDGAGGRLDESIHRSRPSCEAAPGSGTGANAVAAGRDLRRHLVDDGFGQLHDDDHPDAGSRHDDVPPADDDLGACSSPPFCKPSRLPVLTAAGFMQLIDRMLGTGFFMPEGLIVNNCVAGHRRRPAAAVAALVLVLFAPGRVHHDPAGDGHGLRHPQPASPASRSSATSRWSTRSPASPASASSCGATTCSCRA